MEEIKMSAIKNWLEENIEFLSDDELIDCGFKKEDITSMKEAMLGVSNNG